MMFDWAYGGVNSSIPRNVGPDCVNYLSLKWRIMETFFLSLFIISCIYWGYKRLQWPKPTPYINQDRVGKKVLLIMMSLVLGMEIGFKFTSRTVIYLLNPCHITTMLQLYLLAAEPSPTVTALFRIQMNLLNGPLLAFMFPETESRRIFADQAMYYIQHMLMVVIPYYLLRIGGVYNMEPLSDMRWAVFSYGLNAGYHFWIVQWIALPTQVNLSHMLCAAILDPFEGQYYRVWALAHQAMLCPLLNKLMYVTSDFLLTKFPMTKIKPSLEYPLQGGPNYNKHQELCHGTNDTKNGYTHCD